MTIAVEIRRADMDDEETISSLMTRLVAFGPPPWRDSDRMLEVDRQILSKALDGSGEDAVVFVATCDGAIAGFAHLRSQVDQYNTEPHGHLSDIVVDPGFEGQGVGRLLMSRAEDWARAQGYKWLTLSVFSGNERAHAIYEKAGFGADILRMVKPLESV